jgi:hypothetical protein
MKRLIIIAIALFVAGTAVAQDDISKQMEVTRAYTPKVGRAAKLPVEPRMVDTVRLRPEVRYTITPVAWQTVFETPKYAPALLSVAPFTKNRPFYVRTGIGYPLQSTADLYFNPYIGNRSTFGLWLNHRGSYSSIENDLGLKPRSTEMLNEVGLYGSRLLGRYLLKGSLSYDNRIYNAYGVATTLEEIVSTPSAGMTSYSFVEAPAIKLGQIAGHISLGDTFTDLSRLNFGAGLDVGVAHEGSTFYQLDLDGWVRLGRMYGKHGFEVSLSERAAIPIADSWSWNSVTIRLNPNYMLSLDKFSLRAGADIFYIDSSGDVNTYLGLLPRLDATLDLADGIFVPFVTLYSELLNGSREALLRRNPYSTDAAPMGWTLNGRLGFEGTLGDLFSYRLRGGASQLNNFTVFRGYQTGVHIEEGESNSYNFAPLFFAPVTDNGWLYTAGVRFGLNNMGGFSATLHGNWYNYQLDNLAFAIGMPSWDAGLKLAYESKRFAIKAGIDILGKRQFLDYNTLSLYNARPFDTFTSNGTTGEVVTTLGTTVDFSLGAEYNISDDFGLFVEGRNLANQRLYPIAHYAGLGANLMLGIKATF